MGRPSSSGGDLAAVNGPVNPEAPERMSGSVPARHRWTQRRLPAIWVAAATFIAVVMVLPASVATGGTAPPSQGHLPAGRPPSLALSGPLGAGQGGPRVPHPRHAVVVVPILDAYVSHSTTSSVTNSSVYFPVGHFSNITVTFFDQYVSNPFDDSFTVTVNGVEILAGNTLENENTTVTLPVTQYYSILQGGPATVFVTCPQFNPGYASYLSVWFTFTRGPEPAHPSVVVPAFSDINFPTPGNAFPVNVPIPFNVTRSTNVTFPTNVSAAYVQIYEQQNGNDEFWYTLQPPFREFRLFINGTLVATLQPYPNIQSGGGDLYLWQPILALGAESYPPHTFYLTPFLSLLKGTQEVQLEVVNDENLWIRAAVNFLLTTGGPVTPGTPHESFSFSNSYEQSPATNATTESIPLSAAYLNDTETTTETLLDSSTSQTPSGTALNSQETTVSFQANSTIFDPNFDIVQSTPFGTGLVYEQNFSLREYINRTSVTTTQLPPSLGTPASQVSVIETTRSYYQVNGTDLEDIIFSPVFLVVIGFTVTQVRDVASEHTVLTTVDGVTSRQSSGEIVTATVNGTGLFAGELNSLNEITLLTYNHAYTEKSVLTLEFKDNVITSEKYFQEKAVNNSLVLRNGKLLEYTVVYE
jgi:hypothetical protein